MPKYGYLGSRSLKSIKISFFFISERRTLKDALTLDHFYSIIISQYLHKNSFSGLNAQIWLFRSQIPKIDKNQTLFISERRTLKDTCSKPSTTFIAYF